MYIHMSVFIHKRSSYFIKPAVLRADRLISFCLKGRAGLDQQKQTAILVNQCLMVTVEYSPFA